MNQQNTKSAFYPGATRYGGTSAIAKRREAARKAFFKIEANSGTSRPETMNNIVHSYTVDPKDIVRKELTMPHLTSSAKRIFSWIEENSCAQQETLMLSKRSTRPKPRFNPMSYRAPISKTNEKSVSFLVPPPPLREPSIPVVTKPTQLEITAPLKPLEKPKEILSQPAVKVGFAQVKQCNPAVAVSQIPSIVKKITPPKGTVSVLPSASPLKPIKEPSPIKVIAPPKPPEKPKDIMTQPTLKARFGSAKFCGPVGPVSQIPSVAKKFTSPKDTTISPPKNIIVSPPKVAPTVLPRASPPKFIREPSPIKEVAEPKPPEKTLDTIAQPIKKARFSSPKFSGPDGYVTHIPSLARKFAPPKDTTINEIASSPFKPIQEFSPPKIIAPLKPLEELKESIVKTPEKTTSQNTESSPLLTIGNSINDTSQIISVTKIMTPTENAADNQSTNHIKSSPIFDVEMDTMDIDMPTSSIPVSTNNVPSSVGTPTPFILPSATNNVQMTSSTTPVITSPVVNPLIFATPPMFPTSSFMSPIPSPTSDSTTNGATPNPFMPPSSGTKPKPARPILRPIRRGHRRGPAG